MNILMVSSYLPYPLYSGGHIRLYNLIKQLAQEHNIYLVCEKRDYQTGEDVRELEKLCKKVITAPRKKQWSMRNILLAGFSGNSFLVQGHTSKELKTYITEVLSNNKIDLIHAETFYIMQNIPQTKLPITLVEHNIEYLVYQRFADRSPLFIRPLLQFDINKIKRNEKASWQRAAKLIAVSEEEKSIMNRTDCEIVPNGVDLKKYEYKNKSVTGKKSAGLLNNIPEAEFLFIGDFKWMQNRDAARWIINDIWPYLLRAVDGTMKIKLRIVGKNIPQKIKALSIYDSISFDENAPKETEKIYRHADVMLAPVRVAGGTSYKILEAMASGVPVVTTKRGIAGLSAQHGVHVLAADDTQSIVSETVKLLRDTKLYNKIARNARLLIEKEYNWEKIAVKLEKVYESVVTVTRY